MLLIKQAQNFSRSQFRAHFKLWGVREVVKYCVCLFIPISVRKGIATLLLLLLSLVVWKMNRKYTLRKLGQCTHNLSVTERKNEIIIEYNSYSFPVCSSLKAYKLFSQYKNQNTFKLESLLLIAH